MSSTINNSTKYDNLGAVCTNLQELCLSTDYMNMSMVCVKSFYLN